MPVIKKILRDIQLEEVEEGIFSCLAKSERRADYDNKVNIYDMVVSNRFYNRFVWGNKSFNYREFCRQALGSSHNGIYLDAGCGSLVFTAGLYSQAGNELIVLLDRSIGMLAKGRQRIMKLRGTAPDNIIFLQGDIFNLPFRDHVFNTVVSFGLLHIFDNKAGLLSELERVKNKSGEVYLSSLVGNNFVGKMFLELLRRAGEVAPGYSGESLNHFLSTMPFKYDVNCIGNMAYIKSAK